MLTQPDDRNLTSSDWLTHGVSLSLITLSQWKRAPSRLGRFGMTEARFDALLEAQGRACAICREPFEDQRPRIDHDHACWPVPPSGVSRSCGKCVRGLLCVRCNTWLGWMEKYDEPARAYLSRGRAA